MNGFWIGALHASDVLPLFGHFLLLSLISIGGAIATASDMQRYVVLEHGWITDGQFTASVAIAQAAPGPNVLFAAVVGYNVGGLAGVLATMVGMLLPSTTLALAVTRWGRARRDTRGVAAFVNGLAPLSVGLVVSSGWVLAEPARTAALRGHWGGIALALATVVVMLRTRISPIWLVAAGAVVGALGLA